MPPSRTTTDEPVTDTPHTTAHKVEPRDVVGSTTRDRSHTALIAVLLAAETAAVCTTAELHNGDPTTTRVGVQGAAHQAHSHSSIEYHGGALFSHPCIRSKVCAYLPWRDAVGLRAVSKDWGESARNFASLETLPGTDDPALFLPCPERIFDDAAAAEEALRCQHPTKWRCDACGFCNSETRILCGNRACQVPCPSHRQCARLFVGQLRREGTVSLLRWLLCHVFGSERHPVTLVNVENHRHLSTHRGKGCAWVYLDKCSMAEPVLRYHHRVFVDAHPSTGREGVWIVPPGSESVLQKYVQARGYTCGRDLVLPRNALVIEFPLGLLPSKEPSSAGDSTARHVTPSEPSNNAGWGSPPPETNHADELAAATGAPTSPDPTVARHSSKRVTHRHQPYAPMPVPSFAGYQWTYGRSETVYPTCSPPPYYSYGLAAAQHPAAATAAGGSYWPLDAAL